MKLTITRFKEIEDGTIGNFVLSNDGKAIMTGFTLEPAGPDTIMPNKDKRIPKGFYHTTWHDSPKFKQKLPLLFNNLVPNYRYILIHAGNYPKDTQGCILLGDSYDERGVYNSKKTLQKFLEFVKDSNFKVEIKAEY